MIAPLLVPSPRSVKMGQGRTASAPGEVCIDDKRVPRGGYRLRVEGIGGGKVEIGASNHEGLHAARATLAQLRTQYGDAIPEVEIEDAPAFAVRGVMLDISRDRVPTMRQMLETVDLLASLKFNHLQLYTEHTFAYAGHEEVWRGWSPMTADEVRRLDEYCREKGIELAANQNCFGHLGKWLSLPRYRDLAETHGDWMFDNAWQMSGPFSLCPTDPRSIELVKDMLGQLAPCFSSGLMNIGCDETFDIEFGRSKEACRARGRAVVYTEFVQKICDVVRGLGKRPAFWADIALSHPECLATLPKDLVSLAWGYEADSPFDAWCRAVREADRESEREVWVCPGTSTWRTITGRTMERRENLKSAARGGIAEGATGFLVTDWGDTGHHQQWPLTMHALAQAAEAAWGGPRSGELDVSEALSLHVLGDRSLKAGAWLDELGDADLQLRETCGQLSRPDRTRLRNQTALFIDLLKKEKEQVDVGALKDWEAARERVEAITARTPHGMGALMDAELAQTSRFAQVAADRGAWRRREGGMSDEQREELAQRLDAVMEEHRRTWGARCRVGGLEDSCGYLRRMIAELVEA